MTAQNHAASGGLFISFEGIDGSGKSTQARLLAGHIGARALLTREPGGSPGAEEIRQLVLTGDTGRWSAETELLLFTAARRDHLERTIRPGLAQGRVVITDRFADSTRVYQGATRGDLRSTVDRLHDLMIGTEPDLTFIIDMEPNVGLARSLDRLGQTRGAFPVKENSALSDKPMVRGAIPSSPTSNEETSASRGVPQHLIEGRFEAYGAAFQETVRHGFLAIAHAAPNRCRVIDGDRAPEAIAAEIAALTDARLSD